MKVETNSKIIRNRFLDNTYDNCERFYCSESDKRGIVQAGLKVEQQKPLPLVSKEVHLKCSYRIDLLVEERIIVELKTVESLHSLHHKQLLTYLRLANCKLGLLINFNVPQLTQGIKRIVNNL